MNSAFVVNDWYISAYEPIVDSFGQWVGMLYVGFLDTPFQAAKLDIEFNLIYEQVHSVNILVNKLLQFARPEEYAGFVDYHIPDEVINDSIPLVQHLLGKSDIELTLDLKADRPVTMNRTELHQVLINLIVNAIHAMPKGGKLHLNSANKDQNGVPAAEIDETG